MLSLNGPSTKKNKTKVFTLNGSPKILLFKEGDHLFYRSSVIITVKPLQITYLYPMINLFSKPLKVSLKIPLFVHKSLDSYVTFFFLDTDLIECPKKDYDPFLKAHLKLHRDSLELLRKNLSFKDLDSKILSAKQSLDLSFGKIPRSVKRYRYSMEFDKEKEFFRLAVFSHPQIKTINYKRDSIIPPCDIVLGTTLTQKEIGVNSHVLFMGGKKNVRQTIINTLLIHFTSQEQYQVAIFDFGLNIQPEKTLFRKFHFNDILFDPFSFKETYTPSQQSIFLSHMSFIGRTILRFSERQISLLEDKLSAYLLEDPPYSWSSFLKFSQDEVTDDLLTNPAGIASFSKDAVTSDFTNALKSNDDPLKSIDGESLLNKLRFLDRLFTKDNKASFANILFKTHVDLFSITTPPDLKSLSFYLFNLFYTLNDSYYKQFKFFFLDIDSILFDKFTEIDVSWLHPDLKNSLFDATDVYAVKKVFSMIETRIYTSSSSAAQLSFISRETKDTLDQLQILHNYSVLESPTLQRPEYFKLLQEKVEDPIELPSFEIFFALPQLLFSKSVEWTYRQLFSLFDIDYKLVSKLVKENYLKKHSRVYILTEKAFELRKAIIDMLAYQPALNLEENEILIAFSNPVKYNVLFKKKFSYEGNTEVLCTRLLAQQLASRVVPSPLALYNLMKFKQHLITNEELLLQLIVSLQMSSKTEFELKPQVNHVEDPVLESDNSVPELPNIVNEPAVPVSNVSKIDLMKDYFEPQKITGTKTERMDSQDDSRSILQMQNEHTSKNSLQFPSEVQQIVDSINARIRSQLPDTRITFPEYPIFLIMKFLNQDTIDLINNDLQQLINFTQKNSVLPNES